MSKKKIAMEDRVLNSLSIGITFITGKALFKDHTKWSNCYFGICHFSKCVCMITPLDWPKITLLTSIKVSPTEQFCERAYSCLDFTCILNRFDKHIYASEFSDCGIFSLGLPRNISKETPLWFSESPWRDIWPKFLLGYEGGRIEIDEDQAKKILQE